MNEAAAADLGSSQIQERIITLEVDLHKVIDELDLLLARGNAIQPARDKHRKRRQRRSLSRRLQERSLVL